MALSPALLFAFLRDQTKLANALNKVNGACPAALLRSRVADVLDFVENPDLVKGFGGHFVDECGSSFGNLGTDFALDVFDIGADATSF